MIEELYRVFSIYKPGAKLTGCYCDLCLSEDYSNFLISALLNELNPEDFRGYLYSVDILLNNSYDFRYFLPRMLELAYMENDHSDLFFDQLWTVIGRCDHADWPEPEQIALKSFAKEYLAKAYSKHDSGIIDGALLDLKEAHLDVVSG